MLTHPLLEQLETLRLTGIAAALAQQNASADSRSLSFEERLALMIQHEVTERASYRLAQRLRWAKLPLPACLEDLDRRAPRGLDPQRLAQVIDLAWMGEHLNVLITGPTGVGKSFLASAIAHAACRADLSVRCFRLPRLVDELARYAALHKRSSFLRQIAKVDLLVLDDFGLSPLADQTVRDLLEILDDRYDRKSTLITSQLPLDQWHAYLGDRTVADAILDRLIHNAYQLPLKGESTAKTKIAAAGALPRAGQSSMNREWRGCPYRVASRSSLLHDPTRPMIGVVDQNYQNPHSHPCPAARFAHRPGISEPRARLAVKRRPDMREIRSRLLLGPIWTKKQARGYPASLEKRHRRRSTRPASVGPQWDPKAASRLSCVH
jgi:DNA replication protein DnaC